MALDLSEYPCMTILRALQRLDRQFNFPAGLIFIIFLISGCSPKVQQPVDNRPPWLKGETTMRGYYTGIGRAVKDGTDNYIQVARKSALEDLISQIKVTVSSTSILSTVEENRKDFRERYEQIIQTTAADEIEEFEEVGSYEDARNYWVFYRLSMARYREIKEAQKRNAVTLSLDFVRKARVAEASHDYLQALGFYLQALRSIEKYLGEALPVSLDGQEVLLANEIYASVQRLLNSIQLRIAPPELVINRRVSLQDQALVVNATYADGKPAAGVPLMASFAKGAGDVLPEFRTDERGNARLLLTAITSREREQSITVKVNTEALAGNRSEIVSMVIATLNVPAATLLLHVQRPVVYLVADEKSLGVSRTDTPISSRLKNLLATNGFEFTPDRQKADLVLDIQAHSEQGSVSGSIYITYLSGTIRVMSAPDGKEIYTGTLDRIRGFGLDYNRSSQDAYTKAIEMIEKERFPELLNTILK